MIIARWESKSGKHFVELLYDEHGYYYKGNDCLGNFGRISGADALTKMEIKVNTGYFLPDDAKTPMRRVK